MIILVFQLSVASQKNTPKHSGLKQQPFFHDSEI